MAVMEGLLDPHPWLRPHADDLCTAFEWTAEIARRKGMTPQEAGKRLEATMVFEEIADGRSETD